MCDVERRHYGVEREADDGHLGFLVGADEGEMGRVHLVDDSAEHVGWLHAGGRRSTLGAEAGLQHVGTPVLVQQSDMVVRVGLDPRHDARVTQTCTQSGLSRYVLCDVWHPDVMQDLKKERFRDHDLDF